MNNLKKYFYRIGVVLFLIFVNACGQKDPNLHDIIWFENNSYKTLFVKATVDYPDTLIYFSNPASAGNEYKILPNSSDDPLRLRDTYEELFRQIDTLIVFVFDAQVIEDIAWETVKSDYLVLRRYNFSYQDLENINWKISYP
jgi:hypothetical protein